MGRAPCCDKASVKKGPWSPEEDAKLKAYIEQNGTGGNWIALPQKIGLKRCGKSCRLRWLNYLRPNIKHGGFSEEEDNIICSLYLSIGSRWSIIASQLPGRTDNDIKNYWNTRLKKKLIGKQRKELQEARLKQEMVKKENQTENHHMFFSSSARVESIMNQQTLYFPQLPQVFMNQEPNYYYYQTTSDNQEPIKNLIKMEEGRSPGKTQVANMENVTDYQTPCDFSFSQDQFGGFSSMMNSVMSSSTNSPLPNSRYNVVSNASDHHQEMLQGYENFPAELMNDMVFNNVIPSFDGLETNNFYGSCTVGTSNSADQSTISWDDISSLVYHPSHQIFSDQSSSFEDAGFFVAK